MEDYSTFQWVVPTLRYCAYCEAYKPSAEFGKHPGCKYGLRPQCNPCRSQERRDRASGVIPPRLPICDDCGADISHRSVRAHLCEPCGKQRNRDSAQRHVDKDPEAHLAQVKARWTALTKEQQLASTRSSFLKGNYKMSQAEYDATFIAQGCVCAICHLPETHCYKGVVVQMTVDHDHACCPGKKTCGKCIRGLICHDCNSGLGYFDDDIGKMESAIGYLLAWQSRQPVASAA